MDQARAAVLQKSVTLESQETVKGFEFNSIFDQTNANNSPVDYDLLIQSLKNTGFQATNFGRAVDQINQMVMYDLHWRLIQEPIINPESENDEYLDEEVRKNTKCKIFLGYTSNLISSGLRDIIRFLCQHRLVDVIVTTAGGIEEDFIKCLAPTYIGDFHFPGKELRSKGLNRIGNLLVPNDNYCKFEDWLTPILDKLLEEQTTQGARWTPSKVIARLGKEINNPESVYYWAYKNNIPVFCPALTDGSLGDMIYFHSKKNPGLIIDIVEDIGLVNDQAVFAKKTGIILLGGGIIKHHICNANLMRNGADYAVYINTAQEFDGSDSGARPDEAVSWGKIKLDAQPVKIYCDATVVFPLLVAQTFVKYLLDQKK